MPHGPGPVSWLLVALCSVTGLYCLTRLRAGAGCPRAGAAVEAAMGLGMAAMAVPGAMTPDWTPAVFAASFAALAGCALAGALRGVPHGLHHALEASAMAYTAAVAAWPSHGGGHLAAMHGGPGGPPALTGALLLYFAVQVLRGGLALLPAREVPAGAAGTCRLALATGTFAMLLAM